MADFYISSSNLIKNFVYVYTLLTCGGGASDEVFSTALLAIYGDRICYNVEMRTH